MTTSFASRRRATSRLRLWASISLLALVAGCGGDDEPKDYSQFIDLANKSGCTDYRNRVLVIDQQLVLLDSAGNCPDRSYSQILFGDTVNDVLCSRGDTIAGPIQECRVPAYAEMFNTIIAHLLEPDLGLGPSYKIERLK
jgi:hypothetical protein